MDILNIHFVWREKDIYSIYTILTGLGVVVVVVVGGGGATSK